MNDKIKCDGLISVAMMATKSGLPIFQIDECVISSAHEFDNTGNVGKAILTGRKMIAMYVALNKIAKFIDSVAPVQAL